MTRLLIVDDEIHVVDRLATAISWEQIGIEAVFRAYSGFDALEIMSTHSIDIIISDIRMPGMNGLELIREVRTKWRNTKCILLSGHAEFKYAQEAIQHETAGYLLKPVTDEDLLQTVDRVNRNLKAEWEWIISNQRNTRTLRENLPLLRESLLHDLLQGRRISMQTLKEKMEIFQVPALIGEPFAMMMIRLENPFIHYDTTNLSLIEFSIGNIAEELFGERFELWHCKDAHDFLVFVVKWKSIEGNEAEVGGDWKQHILESTASELQEIVKKYLKGSISVLVSRWCSFPDGIATLYNTSISALRKKVGSEQELFMTISDELEQIEMRSLHNLYEFPTLSHLLEEGRWDAVAQKLHHIFDELQMKWSDSEEHLLEVFYSISASFSYIAHKSGRQLSQLIGDDYNKLIGSNPVRSIHQLQDWATRVLQCFEADIEHERSDSRETMTRQIRKFVEDHLSHDVSIQAIADHLYLHRVYVSKIFKLKTGETLSEYIHRIRMEKAINLLKSSDDMVYEIAAQLGYQRAHSFINVFKKHYGVTPQEYRDTHR
ncbi:response regulator [Paenibacillus sp. LMG 31460]|uniref:Response regulator n=1 Tax=Paenibacillus germinis TaxID=2654979 RepID=A0ABX1Z5F3_9BACL|nr:response regulator [Paenibacillus germinis]NOU88392.1 response regulator [Paenibacillus germinis]